MSATIIMHQIYKAFNNNTSDSFRLENINTTFTTEKTYAITGNSGSGKTTLLHLIALLIKPDQGTIIINGKDSSLFSEKDKKHFFTHTVGIVFQQPYVLPELSVLENSMLPGLIHGKSKKECHEKAIHLLKQVDLLPQADLPVKALSGGQQQRVSLARALFNEPSFLLMDEPTRSLDDKNASHIIDLILSLHITYKTGIIICTHDKKTVELMDHCVTLEHTNNSSTISSL
jgi:ABC-type lipoprotein export system ATPase subunit